MPTQNCGGRYNHLKSLSCNAQLALLAMLFAIAAPGAYSQQYRGPQPFPMSPPIKAPVDEPYPGGRIGLSVSATDVAHRVIDVEETVPVKAGELTLLYPAWIPGNHSPTGPISEFAGLEVSANGARIPWTRDRVNVYAFHINVPAGVSMLDVKFNYLTPLKSNQGRVTFSSNLIDVSWNTVALYPAGYFSRDITFAPTITLPEGWHFASALEVASQNGNQVRFKDTTFNTLVDSPLYAGVNYLREDLSTGPNNPVFLDVFADSPKDLAITPEELQVHKNLVEQAAKLFDSHHYSHYDFLFMLSDVLGGEGLEHHQSSEDGTRANYFTDWAAGVRGHDLLGHEYTHSWNGKFRRPADLWTPNFNVPMRDDLLWVYEGLTEYWGYVLTARSGMRSAADTRDLIAQIAANFEASPGRDWRPLVDTTSQPTISQRRPVTWPSWLRGEDYYMEGLLIWLDADTKIRQLSGGKKSLDDFANTFYAMDNGSFVTRTYTFDDIVSTLNSVQPYDWASFFRQRVYELHPQVPEEGITQGGYRLTYSDIPPKWLKASETRASFVSFANSLGIAAKSTGEIGNVWWGSPAFKAGMTPDMTIAAVNGKAFGIDVLRAAIVQAEKDSGPLKLLVKHGNDFNTVEIDYHGGLRYPTLTRTEGTPDLLDQILAPK
jgi:predicted metalloprotease with PDZ domain